jgi:hypothetical protein
MGLLTFLSKRMEQEFITSKYQFFTEHDIHSELFRLANEYYGQKKEALVRTLDRRIVKRVHHEYPTPFRCKMPGFDFELITEQQYLQKKREKPYFQARRGWLDFVSLNSDFVQSNLLEIVTGKNYKKMRASFEKTQPPVLDLALEVIYYHDHSFSVAPGRRRNSSLYALQDYRKVSAVKDYVLKDNIPYAKECALMYFASTERVDELKASLAGLPVRNDVPFLIFGL